MAEMQLVKLLKGHSGCQVELLRNGDQYVVRKTSASESYNDRLIKQVEKQVKISGLLPVPNILGVYTNRNLYAFDMEYVKGSDFRTHCISNSPAWIWQFLQIFFSHISTLENQRQGLVDQAEFAKKIAEIEFRTNQLQLCAVGKTVVENAIYKLKNCVWDNIPRTMCHGDLTLENIIFIEDRTLRFIDTLDSNLETVWLDIAKILFDLEINWSLREFMWTNDGSPEIRLLGMMSRYLRDEIIQQLKQTRSEILSKLDQLMLLQAMRIIPYASDQMTQRRLIDYVHNYR